MKSIKKRRKLVYGGPEGDQFAGEMLGQNMLGGQSNGLMDGYDPNASPIGSNIANGIGDFANRISGGNPVQMGLSLANGVFEMANTAIDNNAPMPTTQQGQFARSFMDSKSDRVNTDGVGQMGSAAIGAFNPLVGAGLGAAFGAGDLANTAIRQDDEYGVAKNDQMAAWGAAFSPNQWIDQSVNAFADGDIGKGLLYANPIGAAIGASKENRDMASLRDRGKQQFANNEMFGKNYNNLNSKKYQDSLTGNTFQLENGGSMNGGNIRKEFSGNKLQQPVNNMTAYYGPSHADGGIPVGDETEVEGGEFKFGSYIFSDKLNYE